jgi:hypothetical protein
MKIGEKYIIEPALAWSESLSDAEILSISQPSADDLALRAAGKGVCYLNKEIIKASGSRTDTYNLMIYDLSNPELLQGGSILEFNVRENEFLAIHRISVIRNRVLLDKRTELNVRIFDDENLSSFGTIHSLQKINVITNDLHLGDTFICEYTKVTIFDDQNPLEKEYFLHTKSFSTGYWFYHKYEFSLINEFKKRIHIQKHYFRNANDELLPEEPEFISVGEKYSFNEYDFQPMPKENYFSPFIEFATEGNWQEISNSIYALYEDELTSPSIQLSDFPSTLEMGQGISIDEEIRRVIEYVQDQIIYLFDAEAMHGHVPQTASVTLRTGAGDCKAKSLLLVNMLSCIGVQSELILVNYGQDRLMQSGSVSPFIFNHVIVKISYGKKVFYVDPTVRGRKGLLEYRSEPLFENYLPVGQNAQLTSKERRTTFDNTIEEETTIRIKGNKASIQIFTICRREVADGTRNNFKNTTEQSRLSGEGRELRSKLIFPENKDWESALSETSYVIVSDDQDLNLLTTRYDAILIDPYQESGSSKVFRYYYPLNTDGIETYTHKDREFDIYISYPYKYRVRIESDKLIDHTNKITTRECDIDNSYFHFTNKKHITFRTCTATIEYMPKTYGYLKKDDFDAVRKDVLKINDSNLGIGIIYPDLLSFSVRNLRYVYIALVLGGIIYGAFSGGS